MRLRSLQHVSSPYPPGSSASIRAFYGHLLGLVEQAVPATLADDQLVWFTVGAGLELHFFPGESGPSSERHFCLDVEDLEETRRRLAAAGYEPYDAREIPHRPRFFCRDPVGNLVEFTRIEEIDPALAALLEAINEVDRLPLAELPPANAFEAGWSD